MNDLVHASLSPQSVGAALIGTFALGAEHSHALLLVLKEGALLVVAGLLIGAPGILVANRLMRGLLVGVTPSHPLALGGGRHWFAARGHGDVLSARTTRSTDRAGAVASSRVNRARTTGAGAVS